MERCYYIVFDIETTGFSIQWNEIIQLAAKIIDNNGEVLEEGSFLSLIKSKGHINQTIASLTGIINELVQNEEPIDIVFKKFWNLSMTLCHSLPSLARKTWVWKTLCYMWRGKQSY